jgi:hypothetical protein
MTTQADEILQRDGREMSMRSAPLEAYWDEHPPRPFLIAPSTAQWRGYTATWQIADGNLYLIDFEAEAWKTSDDWIGDDGLYRLWSDARAGRPKDSVASVIEKLSHVQTAVSPALKRSAWIVLRLAQQLLAKGELGPHDSGDKLYKAAQVRPGLALRSRRFP